MRTVIEFPVVGSKYFNFDLLGLKEGDTLDLVPQPDNEHDPYAVRVLSSGKQVGFVPNKGQTCTACWSGVGSRSEGCSKCGSSWNIVNGGLAYRLQESGALSKNYSVLIVNLDRDSINIPITASIIIEGI